MQKLAIGLEINDQTDENEISRFLDTFFEFSGVISKYPIYIMKPENSKKLSDELLRKIKNYDVNLVEYPITDAQLKFIFTDKVIASAVLEERLDGDVDILAWLAPDTLFINEPKDFLLEDDIALGYRPVHHKLIGSSYDEPLDEFWKICYELLDIEEENVFPIHTCMGEKVRPYFNAGFLIVRPEIRILRTWKDYFLENFDNDIFKKFYQDDVRYVVFVHQIILSTVIISILDQNDLYELPETYNYPLNLLSEIPEEARPDKLSDLITARYDDYNDFFVKKKLYRLINIDEKYKKWFSDVV